MDWLWLAAGLALLVVAGNMLVAGAASMSLRLGIPVMIVGLTVVAFGTSAPELIVVLRAALKGETELALGNVVGSNIVNILLIIGLPALIATIRSGAAEAQRGYAAMMLTAVIFIALCFTGPVGWWQGAILLVVLALTLADTLRSARRAPERLDAAVADEVYGQMPGWRIAALILGGLAGLALGAELLVSAAVNIARLIGVSEAVIGLTLVAVGTSIPELVTSLVAAMKGQAEVALGNVIGSNTFNILAIVGLTSLVRPLPVPSAFLSFDLWVMLGASLLLAPFVLWRRDIGRLAGLGFVALYGVYSWVLVA